LLDRIDLHVEVPPVHYADLASAAAAEPSAAVRGRVNAARQRQRARFAGSGIPHNAAMGVRTIRQFCKLDAGGERLLEQAMRRFGLSARAHDRIRKVARTIADLAGADDIGVVGGRAVPHARPAGGVISPTSGHRIATDMPHCPAAAGRPCFVQVALAFHRERPAMVPRPGRQHATQPTGSRRLPVETGIAIATSSRRQLASAVTFLQSTIAIC